MVIAFIFFITLFAFLACIAFTPLHAILGMLMAYFLTGMFLLFIGLEFLGLIFIAVYAGAVVVLFIFVLMVTNYPSKDLISNSSRVSRYGLLYSFILLIGGIGYPGFFDFLKVDFENTTVAMVIKQSDLVLVGENLYAGYFLWLSAVAIILFISLVSVVTSTSAYKKKYLRRRSST